MEHFKGINDQERFSNEVLNHMRKQTELLEQIARLLQQKGESEDVTSSTEGIPLQNTRKRQPRQRGGNSNGIGRKRKST